MVAGGSGSTSPGVVLLAVAEIIRKLCGSNASYMSAIIAVVTRIVAAAAISDVMGAGWQWQQVAKTK